MGESLQELSQLVSSGREELWKYGGKILEIIGGVVEKDYYEVEGENYNLEVEVTNLQC